ncbi:GNAT family N-acetyltransferase [Croceivirga thetidis]|uniref:GNAT family N-acetyltransferase n=1 Tax=Croceivirga thetidis TaxID=2721623 RepID=A0ABX1GPX8_9FLAO|nr:N-acetyltransferase [Croceivirga thetidis]NKI31135.1 GNAT family N-acetyltransferase [Croceivirga thetidis]
MDLKFELVTIDSLKLLQQIGKKTFTDAFKSQNNPEDFGSYIESAFSMKTLRKELTTNGTAFFFVRNENMIVGYFKINEFDAQTELKEQVGIELERIYVLKEFQSKGIGKRILKNVEKLCHEKFKDYLWLGVWEKNKKAIKFYQKNGFVKFGEHPYYIGNDKQTDWLMKKTL